VLAKPSSNNQDPLHRLFAREGVIGQKLLVQVTKDLNDVVKVCEGNIKQTNHLRALMSSLTKGELPTMATKLRRTNHSRQAPSLTIGGDTK
jgi:dynein heavy chain 1